MRVRIISDSSAVVGISKRRGVGKVIHNEFDQVWLQDLVNRQEVAVKKVKGTDI